MEEEVREQIEEQNLSVTRHRCNRAAHGKMYKELIFAKSTEHVIQSCQHHKR